jgi:hypothetical protein
LCLAFGNVQILLASADMNVSDIALSRAAAIKPKTAQIPTATRVAHRRTETTRMAQMTTTEQPKRTWQEHLVNTVRRERSWPSTRAHQSNRTFGNRDVYAKVINASRSWATADLWYGIARRNLWETQYQVGMNGETKSDGCL